MLRSLSLFVLSLVSVPLAAKEPPKITIEKNVAYCKVGDKELKLDIAMPMGKGPFPAVLCVHGGAWRFGQRQDCDSYIECLANEGFVAATVSYRLLPDAKFPDPLVDCKTAVRFLRAQAGKYRIDKDRIGALGFSSGAHLVDLLGTTESSDGFDGKEHPGESSAVQAVVSYFGPSDLTLYGNDESAENSTFVPMLGARYKDKPDLYKWASPINYASKNSAPFLLVHGTKDWLVPIEHSRRLCKKLKEAGVEAELVEVQGAAHGWDDENNSATTDATIKFLRDHLKK